MGDGTRGCAPVLKPAAVRGSHSQGGRRGPFPAPRSDPVLTDRSPGLVLCPPVAVPSREGGATDPFPRPHPDGARFTPCVRACPRRRLARLPVRPSPTLHGAGGRPAWTRFTPWPGGGGGRGALRSGRVAGEVRAQPTRRAESAAARAVRIQDEVRRQPQVAAPPARPPPARAPPRREYEVPLPEPGEGVGRRLSRSAAAAGDRTRRHGGECRRRWVSGLGPWAARSVGSGPATRPMLGRRPRAVGPAG